MLKLTVTIRVHVPIGELSIIFFLSSSLSCAILSSQNGTVITLLTVSKYIIFIKLQFTNITTLYLSCQLITFIYFKILNVKFNSTAWKYLRRVLVDKTEASCGFFMPMIFS